jgi:UDP-N-acetyl-D-glucosamine dehydrogenase
VSSPEVAEAAKLFENTFRQVNIALVNEFAQIADALKISTFETLEAAATKPYGFMSFMPSVGVGGHCIPVDPSYLSFAAEKAGVEAAFINLANNVNAGMPRYVATRIADLLGGSVKGKRIQVVGISYKADVSDTRESPALALIKVLREMGALVSWHDEIVGEFSGEASKPLAEVDLGVIATAHSGVDYSAWKNSGVMVIDVSTSSKTGWPKFL